MIKSFRIVNHLGESITIDIRKPEETGFLISSVTGLNDPKAEISTTPSATFDGSVVGNTRVEQRNIVMNIVFQDDNKDKESIEDLRWKCYRFFPLRKQITFYVTNDHGTFWTKGYVEANEINIFSKQEANQVSIICPDPYFVKDGVDQTAWISQVEPMFHFEVCFDLLENPGNRFYNWNSEGGYSFHSGVKYDLITYGYEYEPNFAEGNTLYISGNPEIYYTREPGEKGGETVFINRIENSGGILAKPTDYYNVQVFGRIKDYPETIIDYEGSAEAGFIVTIEFTGPVSNIRLNNITRNESMILDTEKIKAVVGSRIQRYDTLVINTNKGNKSITLYRDGLPYNVMHCRASGSQWIYLQNGPNRFTCTAESGINNMDVKVTYPIRLFGV